MTSDKIKSQTKLWVELYDMHNQTLSEKMKKVIKLLPKFGCNSESVKELIEILTGEAIPQHTIVRIPPYVIAVRTKEANTSNNEVPVLFLPNGTGFVLNKGNVGHFVRSDASLFPREDGKFAKRVASLVGSNGSSKRNRDWMGNNRYTPQYENNIAEAMAVHPWMTRDDAEWVVRQPVSDIDIKLAIVRATILLRDGR